MYACELLVELIGAERLAMDEMGVGGGCRNAWIETDLRDGWAGR